MIGRLQKLFTLARERGPFWTAVYALRTICLKIIPRLDLCLIRIEKRNFLTGDLTVSSSLNTLDQNKKIWNNYDWSLAGDEWTLDAKRYKGIDPDLWKGSLISKIMFKYIKERSSVLEIGPGAGRWTEVLQPVCHRLLVADISARCLSICKERFGACANVEYYLIEDGTLPFIPDNSVDYVWSYDVFVHINSTDIERYIGEIKRILRMGGHAIIHHAGDYSSEQERSNAFRSHMNGRFFANLVRTRGMKVVEQDDSLPHMTGDVISVFVKSEASG